MTAKIAILILHYKNIADTYECLTSVFRISYPHFSVIVIDNCSTDLSELELKERFPKVTILKNKANLGYAEGNNRGISYAMDQGYDFFFLLNNDTVVHPNILHAFIDASTAFPSGGIFGAKVYFYDEPTQISYAGGTIDPHQMRCIHIGCGQSDLEKNHEEVVKTDYACGCALLVRKEVVQKCGMMDSRFFLIWEEVDWCWKIRKAGFDCFFVPMAKIWHKVSTSFEGGNRGPLWQYYYFRNRLLFMKNHFSLKERWRFYRNTFAKEVLDLCKTSFSSKTDPFQRLQYRAALRGVVDYFLHKNGSKE
ncbi:MAG: glycosyltransferase family 2 protein [Chlamydiae bacterium]|nr:glycosyltransferase family 2 protein [Chlamydiota bacterium]